MGQALGRERRLGRPGEFDAVLQAPSVRLRRGPLWLAARPTDAGQARLGLIVGKRLLRRAVDRNRTKRLIRESFRQRGDLPAMDIVVRVVGVRGKSRGAAGVSRIEQADRLFAALTAIVEQRAGRACAG